MTSLTTVYNEYHLNVVYGAQTSKSIKEIDLNRAWKLSILYEIR